MQDNLARPVVWITYSWADDAGGDFSFLVQELDTVGVQATYDRIELIPGRDMWAQIGERISNGQLEGWAYLLTPGSLASEPCREELAYALTRTLASKGREFPLIGLLHGVRIQDVPPALRIRLCVSLASPSWKEEVRAGLTGRPPGPSPARQTRFVWVIHQGYAGEQNRTAIEVRPRFGEIAYWRFAVPLTTKVVRFGRGPTGGGAIGGLQTMKVTGGEGADIGGVPVQWFGAGDVITPGMSAYAVLDGPVPEFAFFGRAAEPTGPPSDGELHQF